MTSEELRNTVHALQALVNEALSVISTIEPEGAEEGELRELNGGPA